MFNHLISQILKEIKVLIVLKKLGKNMQLKEKKIQITAIKMKLKTGMEIIDVRSYGNAKVQEYVIIKSTAVILNLMELDGVLENQPVH